MTSKVTEAVKEAVQPRIVTSVMKLSLNPQELDVIVGALQLAPMPHKSVHPVLESIGRQVKAQMDAQNGQKSDNGGTTNRRGKRTAGETVPALPG